MIDIKAIREAEMAHIEFSRGYVEVPLSTRTSASIVALCDEIERLQHQLTLYEKHGVTCQTFGHKLTGCAECNRDDEMALDTLKLQARRYFELLPKIESLRNGMLNIANQSTEPAIQAFARSYLEAKT